MTFARNIEYRERRAREKEVTLRAPFIATVRAERAGTYAHTEAVADPKTPRAPGGKAEQAHKDALAQLGCMACRRLYPGIAPGPVELHHLREGGWGKGDYMTLIPLCVEHHRGDTGVHGLGTKAFAAFYGFTQTDLLADALSLLEPA